MKKKPILDEVVFILFLSYITVTCRHTITQWPKEKVQKDKQQSIKHTQN
jgi:hypothetical protein